MHYVLDISFGEDKRRQEKTREDKSRVRRDHGSKNLASIRDIAANLHRRPPKAWGAIKARMKQAGWNEDYLLQLLV